MSNKPNIRLGVDRFLQTEATRMPFWLRRLCRPLACLLDKHLTWSAYNRFASRLSLELSFEEFIQACMKEYNLSVLDVDNLRQKIPCEGPLVIVSNHPTGFSETILLPYLIMKVRPDLKILANEMLAKVHWVAPHIIPLNVFKASGVKTILQKAEQWLLDGGVLLIYPSGEVADYKKDHGRVTDGEWSRLPLMLAEKSDAKIIHLNLVAKTSYFFQAVSRVCRPIRVLWLMKELYRQGGKAIACYSSGLTAFNQLPSLPKIQLTKFLHVLNDCLPLASLYQKTPYPQIKTERLKPLADQIDLAFVRKELLGLPDDAVIYRYQSIVVYVAKGSDIPQTLSWIQVERERAFREVNMGTGQSSDGDQHDEKTWHVIAWDTRKEAMIATTRCDIFCEARKNTYLADLYAIDADRLLEQGDMMEISRTFILKDYQRSFSSLLSLWRGLARVVLRHDRIRFISGVVSIAGDKMNQSLFDCLATYVHLQAKRHPRLAELFEPHYPYQIKQSVPPEVQHCLSLIHSVDEIEYVFSELTKGSFQLPVLFRQYESLGTVPLAISVDDAFGCCIDVLQTWDTHDLRSEKLRLFFGDEGMDEMKRRAT